MWRRAITGNSELSVRQYLASCGRHMFAASQDSEDAMKTFFSITVQKLDGSSVSVQVPVDSRVIDVKREVERIDGTPACAQLLSSELTYNLENKHSLLSCHVDDGAVLSMAVDLAVHSIPATRLVGVPAQCYQRTGDGELELRLELDPGAEKGTASTFLAGRTMEPVGEGEWEVIVLYRATPDADVRSLFPHRHYSQQTDIKMQVEVKTQETTSLVKYGFPDQPETGWATPIRAEWAPRYANSGASTSTRHGFFSVGGQQQADQAAGDIEEHSLGRLSLTAPSHVHLLFSRFRLGLRVWCFAGSRAPCLH